jgi:hypothetical protein
MIGDVVAYIAMAVVVLSFVFIRPNRGFRL